jgi:hypothetical protein
VLVRRGRGAGGSSHHVRPEPPLAVARATSASLIAPTAGALRVAEAKPREEARLQ